MRNLPESYLQALQEHFAKAPNWFSGQDGNTVTRPNLAPSTTNQDGRNTAFQRWFNFKEAFAPAFVSTAIESLGYTPDHIVDPFGGSGTTAITAQLLSLNATTIEVNPFMADVIASKVSYISAEVLRSAAAQFQANLASTPVDLSRLTHLPPTFIEAKEKDRWIFPSKVAKRLTQYLACIEKISNVEAVEHRMMYSKKKPNSDQTINNNHAESFFSRLRRAEYGVFHRFEPRYMMDYANEAAWREDWRRMSVRQRFEGLIRLIFQAGLSRWFRGYYQGNRRQYELLNQ